MKSLNYNPRPQFIVILFLTGIISSCMGRPAANLDAPPPVYVSESIKGPEIKISFNPQVEVVFFIDNSDSMKAYQELLIQGMKEFANAFGKNTLMDYRLGVATPYDRRNLHLLINERGKLCRDTNTSPEENENRIDCTPPGHLRQPFISRSPTLQSSDIEKMLTIGTLPTDKGGPRYEEFFYPILNLFNPQTNADNGHFLREQSQKYIIIVTDEGDQSPGMSETSFLQSLARLVDPKQVSLYGILWSRNSCNNQEFFATKPSIIINAINIHHGAKAKDHIFSICDTSYANHLAAIGNNIRQHVQRTEIVLNSIPQDGTLILKYGGHIVKPGPGWGYNPRNRTLFINGGIELPIDYDPNLQFSVEMTQITPNSIKRGKAEEIL